MPRKYQDGGVVAVHYATKRMSASFLGVVQKYESGKYYVRYISGDKSFDSDKVFECNTREMSSTNEVFTRDMAASQMQVYFNQLKNHALSISADRQYASNANRFIWSSFAAKRSIGSYRQHGDTLCRSFPSTQIVWRNEYV